jgi:nucleotide-binding universal stress UspA family protein
MKKILVPVDFSANSKSAVRFAVHWASLQKLELVFIHVLHILRPIRWSDSYFAKFADEEEKFCRTKFEKFIAGIYKNLAAKTGRPSIVIIKGISADIAILDYCSKNHDIEYICISTRGAGKFNKIFGTNTGNLITHSEVPVIAIPKSYKVADIKSVLYASDFHNYPEELNKVIGFALPLKASIEVLHFTWPGEIAFDENTIEGFFKNRYKYGLKVHFEKTDASLSLVEHIQKEIKVKKPSVLIMFTNQKRTIFQKLFLSSKAEELSFQLKIPLLVFSKGVN